MDNDENGWIRCKPTRTSLSLIAYKIPRDKLEDRTEENTDPEDLEALGNSGIYILVGRNSENDDAAYIGQVQPRKSGESFLARFSEHEKAKDFWTEAIVFTTTTTDPEHRYQATALNYLEYLFIKKAEEANKYKIVNKQHPGKSAEDISKTEKNSYNEDYEIAKDLVYALGHRVFVKTTILSEKETEKEPQTIETIKIVEQINEKLDKNTLKTICEKNEIQCGEKIHVGSLDKDQRKTYWFDIKFDEFTEKNITLVLQDWTNKKLYILNVPKATIKQGDLKAKVNDLTKADIKFNDGDLTFTDKNSNYSFKDFYKKTIDYGNVGENEDQNKSNIKKTESKKNEKDDGKKKPVSFKIGGYFCDNISSYKSLIDEVVSYLVSINENIIYNLAQEDFSITTRKKRTPYITLDESKVRHRKPNKIKCNGFPVYYITNLNSNDTKKFVFELVRKYGFSEDDLKIIEVAK